MSDLKFQLNKARQRVLAGEKLSLEEQKELLEMIRQSRTAAAESGTKARTKRVGKTQAKTGVSDAELDAQLADLGL